MPQSLRPRNGPNAEPSGLICLKSALIERHASSITSPAVRRRSDYPTKKRSKELIRPVFMTPWFKGWHADHVRGCCLCIDARSPGLVEVMRSDREMMPVRVAERLTEFDKGASGCRGATARQTATPRRSQRFFMTSHRRSPTEATTRRWGRGRGLVARCRTAWFDMQPDIDADKLAKELAWSAGLIDDLRAGAISFSRAAPHNWPLVLATARTVRHCPRDTPQ